LGQADEVWEREVDDLRAGVEDLIEERKGERICRSVSLPVGGRRASNAGTSATHVIDARARSYAAAPRRAMPPCRSDSDLRIRILNQSQF